jgi:nucleoid-associated protein YgaU
MKRIFFACLALILTAGAPVMAQATDAETEALRKALEQALRENISLRADLEAARAEIDRLRGGAVRPIAMAPAVAAPAARTHTVLEGETLGSIAAHYYRTPSAFTRIYEANRDRLSNPNLIIPGQTLRIP